jgi:TonB family protein
MTFFPRIRSLWLVGLVLAAGGGLQAGAEDPESFNTVDLAAVDVLPEAAERTAPRYPYEMRRSGYRGRVDLRFVVDEEGRPRAIEVVYCDHPAFERPAVEAVLNWRFTPARREGKAVAVRVIQRIEFAMNVPGGGAFAFEVPPRAPKEVPEAYRYDEAPEVQISVPPVYPRELALNGVVGEASVVFRLDEAGVPAEVTVHRASAPEFGAALVAAVECWRLKPAKKDGAPSPALLSFKYRFRLGRDADLSGSFDRRLMATLKRDGGESLTSLSALDEKPRVLFRSPPVYPLSRRQSGEGGRVVVRFIIDREGLPRLPVVESATDEAFAWAALTAVQRQLFTPPMRDGKGVDVWAVLPVEFKPAR